MAGFRRAARLAAAALALAALGRADPGKPPPPPAHPAPAPAHPAPAPGNPAPSPANPAPSPANPAPGKSQPGTPLVQGLIRLGDQTSGRGDYATAEVAYWQVLHHPDLAPGDEKTALLGLAKLLRRQGSLTKAAAIYERFVKDFPSDERVPDALLELGRTHRELGAYKLALGRFYSVINSTLKLPSAGFEHYELLAKTAQFEIAQTHYAAGEYAEAGKFFRRVSLLDLSPADRARAQFMAARSDQEAGDDSAAVNALWRFLTEFPDDENSGEARFLLATTLRRLHRPEQALAVTMELLRGERRKGGTGSKGWAYWQKRTGNEVANELFQAGNVREAMAIYHGLQALSPEPYWRLSVGYQEALCQLKLGLTGEATATLRAIVTGAQIPGPDKAPRPEMDALAKMAAWQLEQLGWQERSQAQFDAIFARQADSPPAAPPAPAAPTGSPGG